VRRGGGGGQRKSRGREVGKIFLLGGLWIKGLLQRRNKKVKEGRIGGMRGGQILSQVVLARRGGGGGETARPSKITLKRTEAGCERPVRTFLADLWKGGGSERTGEKKKSQKKIKSG